MNRRALLTGAAALAACRFLTRPAGARIATGRLRLDRDPFPLGVASGEPSRDGFVIWTRITDLQADVPVAFEIAEDEGFRRIIRTGRALAARGRGGAVHVEVAGLAPGRPYFYRFHLGRAVSRIGRTLTVPANPQRLRFAATSCQHWEHGWFSAYRDMVTAGAECVVQLGDYIYERSFGSGPSVRAFGAPEPRTLEDYRARHALYRTDPDLAAAHAAMPFLVSWDDHEVENDYAANVGGTTVDPQRFLRRRAAAYQAYLEHMPIRPSMLRASGELRLYRRAAWGSLATFHILDTRQYRSRPPCFDPERPRSRVLQSCEAAVAPDATILGAAQERWLAQGLAGERARWTLIAQQTLFSRLFLPGGPAERYSDIWDGYAAGRDRLVQHLSSGQIRNPIILSGDVHSFWVNDVTQRFDDARAPTIATEFVTTCLASRNAPGSLIGQASGLNPHVRFLDNSVSGYVLVDLDCHRLTTDLRAVESLTDPASRCRSLKQFIVEDRRPGALA